jgi:secondary thiamine-phosphate synthase enzyme
MFQKDFSISTNGQGLTEITNEIDKIVLQSQTEEGLCNVFIKHTSASLLIQENASPDVLSDLNNFFKQLVPESGSYLHSIEGADDMPAHIKNALTLSSLLIPVKNKSLDIGTWQGIFLFEHRHSKFKRQVNVSVFN